MLTRLGPPPRRMIRRTSAVVLGLMLIAGVGAASAPSASAAPAVSHPAAQVILAYQLVNYGSYGLCLDLGTGTFTLSQLGINAPEATGYNVWKNETGQTETLVLKPGN